MPALLLPLLALLVALGVAGAACAAAETSLFSLSAADRHRMGRTHPGPAAAVRRLLANPRRLLIGLLTLNTTVLVGYTVVASFLAVRLGAWTGTAWADGIFRAATLAALILLVEIPPKSIASVHRTGFARRLAGPFEAVLRVIAPVIWFVDTIIVTPVSRLVRPAGAGEAPPVTPDELRAVLEVSAGHAGLKGLEQDLLERVLELGDIRVREVMTPRLEVRWLQETGGESDVVRAVRETGHSRFPVCRGSIDGGIVGLLNANEFLAAAQGAAARPTVKAFAKPVQFVPERTRLDRLLSTFRETSTHVAVCVDEYGQVTGIIEIEDAVRRLVTPTDELSGEAGEAVQALDDGSFLVPGRLNVRQMTALFEWTPGRSSTSAGERALSQVSTLSGLIFSMLGRLPRVGDRVQLRNVRFTVESVEGRTVRSVRVRVQDDEPAPAAGGAV